MPSFLEKLKLRKGKEKEQPLKVAREEDSDLKVLQLDVDIYRKANEILVYTQVPGASSDDLDISVHNDNDILIIRGKRKLPGEEIFPEKQKAKKEKEGKWLCQECQWGSFYRQIILPEEVDSLKTKAELKKGVLILRLPFLKPKTGKMKIEIKEE